MGGAGLSLSREQARRFLVRRHLLDPPRSLAPTPRSILEVVDRIACLQFDPIEVPGARNHDLVLHARIADYDRRWCDELLYAPKGRRELFEAYNKSLNLLPVAELPWYRFAWKRARSRYDEGVLRVRARAVRTILRRIRRDGPLTSAAFADSHQDAIDWHWSTTSEGRALLEALFETGRVGIAGRDRNRRTFDLIERLFPQTLLRRRVPVHEARRHRLLSRHRGHGLLGAGASTEILVGTGPTAERARMTRALVDDGVLVPVEVEGVRGARHVVASERTILDAVEPVPTTRAVTFVAPLDPLLWDRRLLRSLFDFDYVWEVYTPEAKRRHGYYVLPILFGDRLVGRIEPRMDRERGALHLVGLWFERGFDPVAASGFVPAFADALAAYVAFVSATRLSWPRGKVAQALRRAVQTHAPVLE